ncbi:MAG TPA: PKD domain-containing protein, partial [Bacteroidia bacterium]|nr:PKD domain-containing protein [Bacteroidia bacterium]
CGSSNSVDGDVNGQHGGSDFWVVKLNAGGTILWDRCFGGSDQEAALTLACNNTSGILVSGYSRSINGDLHQNFGYNDMWSILLDQNGSLVSQKILGGPGTDISFSAIGTLDGGFLLAGGTTSQSGDITFNYGQEDIWLTKLDQNLNTEWEKSYGGSRNERPSSLVQTPDGGFVFSGYSYSNDGNVSGNHGSADYWIVHLSCTQPDAIFSTPYDSLCTGMTAFFSNHSLHSAAYSWTANQQFVSTSEDVSILLSAPGMYNVSLIAQTCYASDTLQQLISAIAPPEIKVSTSQSHLCIGDSIELSVAGGNSCLWNTGETTSSIYVHSRGPFVATVNYSGCPSSSSPVYLNATAKPTLNLGADTAICTGTSLLLQVAFTSGLSFLWQDGSTLSSYSVSQPGNYCVQVSDAHCFSRDTIRVDTFNCSSPTASFTVATQQICEHGTVSFLNNSSQASSWIWSFPGGNPANSTLENPVIRYDAAGTYSVTLTVSNGQQTQTLMRWNYIVVNALPDRPQIEVNGFLLSTSTAYTYQWFLNSTAIAGAGSEYYLASVDGFYQVSITDSHQCSALSDSVYLSVTGTDKTDHGTEMRVFPNPVNDQLHCTIKKLTNETGLLRILDVQGRALIRREITEVGSIADFTFDLSALPSGLYILDFTGISVTRFQYKIQKL